MKLDVFIRVTDAELKDPLRKAMLEVTVARWSLEPVTIHTIVDYPIWQGRKFAEATAQSDIYIFTDSDVLIVGKDWVSRGENIFKAWPEYGAVSTLSLVETENTGLPKPENQADDIYPMHAVGAPMWIRKGLLKFEQCPHCREEVPLDGDGDHIDGSLSLACTGKNIVIDSFGSECFDIYNYLGEKGYKEGLFNPSLKLRHNHMGHAFSSYEPLHWGF